MTGIEVSLVPDDELAAPLELLEGALRGGESLPGEFVKRLRGAVASGGLEVLAARTEGRTVGVVVVAYRPNVSVAADFASIEELYVRREHQRQGVGRALMEAVESRCVDLGVSYVEVQTDEEAEPFYAALGYEVESDVRVMTRTHAL